MDTGVKAGIIKCATDEPGVTPDVERVLRAAAQAHRKTGVPISTHTHAASEVGLKQQDVFESEGADLSRIVIGHSGDTEDTAYLKKVCDRGSFIGMDRFGVDLFLETEKRVATIKKMCDMGYADHMVLSHDAACHFDWVDPPLRERILPNWHYNHIPDDVIPALRKAGVTEEQVTTMTVDNPRRVFERQGAY
jgi:phosphotriesterase-related protein